MDQSSHSSQSNTPSPASNSSGGRRRSYETEQSVKVYEKFNKTLTWQDAYKILRQFDPSKHRHISSHVESARGGEIYIFYNTDPVEALDWRADNFQWVNQSNTSQPSHDPVLKKNYWWVKDKNKQKGLSLT
jgi:hypothetical protein